MRTGRLRASGRIEYSGFFSFRPKATIIFDVDYAGYVNDGTAPHIIRPKRPGGVLRFRMGSRLVYARYVNHPGTRANPFLDRALREVAAPYGYRITNVTTR